MEIVIGLSLKNLNPRVWDPTSPYYLPQVRAVMVSYAEFHNAPSLRKRAMEAGLHKFLGVPEGVRVYLDNGSFSFLRKDGEVPRQDYETFVIASKPDWYPTPQDYIPAPMMLLAEQHDRRQRTMAVNRDYRHDGFVPVLHVGTHLPQYMAEFQQDEQLAAKPRIALGGIVPNLLRAPKALPYRDVLTGILNVREALANKEIHVFGMGGTATIHVAALLGMDSVDSSGWRNRGARGIIQLPGRGDRLVAELGSWRGRTPSADEWAELVSCPCPACVQWGVEGLRASGKAGFCNRATHNLHVLLEEASAVQTHLTQGLDVYKEWYLGHIDNTVYKPLIEFVLALKQREVVDVAD